MSVEERAIGPRESLLHKRGLDDPAVFEAVPYFDEIPFYSRFSQIAFLRKSRTESFDQHILLFAIDYLADTLDAIAPREFLLAAVTVVDFGPDDPIVPNLFLCHGKIPFLLESGLVLDPPASRFARRIKGMLPPVFSGRRLEVLQDTRTIPGQVRVFLGLRPSKKNRLILPISFLKSS